VRNMSSTPAIKVVIPAKAGMTLGGVLKRLRHV
jgi:hypothetical protein